MTTPDRAEALARVLREVPVSDKTDAFLSLLLIVALDMVQTSPADVAHKLASLARAMGD